MAKYTERESDPGANIQEIISEINRGGLFFFLIARASTENPGTVDTVVTTTMTKDIIEYFLSQEIEQLHENGEGAKG